MSCWNDGAFAIDQSGGAGGANKRHGMTRHQQFCSKQRAVGRAEDQYLVLCHLDRALLTGVADFFLAHAEDLAKYFVRMLA